MVRSNGSGSVRSSGQGVVVSGGRVAVNNLLMYLDPAKSLSTGSFKLQAVAPAVDQVWNESNGNILPRTGSIIQVAVYPTGSFNYAIGSSSYNGVTGYTITGSAMDYLRQNVTTELTVIIWSTGPVPCLSYPRGDDTQDSSGWSNNKFHFAINNFPGTNPNQNNNAVLVGAYAPGMSKSGSGGGFTGSLSWASTVLGNFGARPTGADYNWTPDYSTSLLNLDVSHRNLPFSAYSGRFIYSDATVWNHTAYSVKLDGINLKGVTQSAHLNGTLVFNQTFTTTSYSNTGGTGPVNDFIFSPNYNLVQGINGLWIGSAIGAYFQRGLLGPVYIYNRRLSTLEIQDHFNATRGRFGNTRAASEHAKSYRVVNPVIAGVETPPTSSGILY